MILARVLTPAEFGISMAALFFIQLSARLSDLGLNAALVRARVVTPLHLSSVFVVSLGVGFLSFLALLAIAPWGAAFYGIPEIGRILPVAAVSFLISPFGTVQGAILTRDGRFRESSIVDWYFCITFAVVSTALALLGFSFWSLVYARLASVGTQVLSRVYYERWRPSLRFSRSAMREVLGFGIGMQAKGFLDYLAKNLDNLIVGKLMGMAALGIYDKAFSTMNRAVTRLNTGGPSVMFRIFSLIQDDPGRFHRA